MSVLCTFWRHFAVLTLIYGLGHIWDHLFLAREGWAYWKSQEFKVVTFERVLEIGSMAGLITLFRRHSEFILTLGYYTLNLALIGPRGGYVECEETGVRRGLARPWSAGRTQITPVWLLVGPWQYQS